MKNKNKRAGKPARKPRRQINKDGQDKRMERLNAEARLKGWKGISEYLTAVIKHEAELPEKMS